jgi:hypothetical protein
VVNFCPHGAGTHTECAAHVLGMEKEQSDTPRFVTEVDVPPFAAGVVATVVPVRRAECDDAYPHPGAPDDLVISRAALQTAVKAAVARAGRLGAGVARNDDGGAALPPAVSPLPLPLPLPALAAATLVLRVPFVPAGGSGNDSSDQGGIDGPSAATVDWDGSNPPYLTQDCAAAVRALGFQHLVTNLPSVDRGDDGGALAAHREIFAGGGWAQTITELASVPEATVTDGVYILELRIARFVLDAAPSEPRLFECTVGV